MTGAIIFAAPGWVHLVWPALAVTLLLAWLEQRGRDAFRNFVAQPMHPALVRQPGAGRRYARLALVLAAMLLGIVALMRPQTPGGTETLSSRPLRADIMVALDVSRSMLAEDAAPNRLARARAEIAEFVDRVAGHRVGLIAFAGRASVMTPLTSDYGYFRLVLRNVDTDSAGRGGTRIGDAIRRATAAFGANRGRPRVLLLITDGEDHDSLPIDALREAVAAGIRIVAIGFGSETGSPITLTDPNTGARTTLRDADGQVVQSRLDGDLLRRMALESEGVYVPAGTSAVDLDAIIEAHVEPLVSDTSARVLRRSPIEHFRWFVLGALACLTLAVWLTSSSSSRGISPSPLEGKSKKPQASSVGATPRPQT